MTIDRKAATAAWKERKTAPGIYAIRCTPSGETWMGQAADMATIQNRHWFSLRLGIHSNRAMQAAWNAHGAEAMVFEPLELLPDVNDSPASSSQLRDALRRWRDESGAPAA